MGAEAKCTATIGRSRVDGKALLETDALIFRGGDVRLSIPYKDIVSVAADDGTLRVTHPGGTARFELGVSAAKWCEKIRHPPSRADKLGVKAGQRVLVVNVGDEALKAELASRGATLLGRSGANVDVIFLGVRDRAGLAAIPSCERQLKRDGAIWIVRPKGSAAISEADVMKAGKDAGLVDVKVVRFSDTHTAEKFVVPLKNR